MNGRGQGAIEYLLLIGGAVLVATVILLILLSTAPQGGGILNNHLGNYDDIDLDDVPGSSGPPPEDFDTTLVLENDDIQFEFIENPLSNEDVILNQLTQDGTTTFSTNGVNLWDVVMVSTTTAVPVGTVSPQGGACDPVQYSQWKSGATNIVEWYWNNCIIQSNPSEYIHFKLRIELDDGSTIARWRPSVENHSPYGISLVELFLDITPHSNNDRYLMPGVDGVLIEDPTSTLPAFHHALHLEFFQVQAWYDPAIHEGIYFATLDPRNSRSKYYSRTNDGSMVRFGFGAYGEEPLTTKGFNVPYSLAIGTFKGDWYDAVQIYRKWVLSQNIITSAGKLKNRTDVPLWYKELGLQLIQNYSVDSLDLSLNPNAVAVFENVKDYYLPCNQYHSTPSSCTTGVHADQPLSLFQWTWYNQYNNAGTWAESHPTGGADGYGEYDMINRLENFVKGLDTAGIYMQGYTQPGIYSQGGPHYSTLSSQAMKKSDGSVVMVAPHPGDPPIAAVMDPASDTWQNHFAQSVKNGLVDPTQNHFGHGIYMDNPYANYGINFSSTIQPTHTKGKGGNHFYEGFRNMMIETRNTAKTIDPNFILFHEQGMEAYVGASDSFSNGGTNSPFPAGFDETNMINVPVMEILYHDYQLFNSSNSNPDWGLGHYNFYQGSIPAYLESIQVNTAIGFSYGRMINTAEPFAPVGQPNHIIGGGQMLPYTEFLKHLIKVRKSAAKEYLIYGEMLRPLSAFGGETTYTYKDVYGNGDFYTIDVPNVLSSVWKASDGSIGIVLVNPTNTNRTITVPFDPSDYGKSTSPSYSELNLDTPSAHISSVVFNKPFSGFGSPIVINARSTRVIRVA